MAGRLVVKQVLSRCNRQNFQFLRKTSTTSWTLLQCQLLERCFVPSTTSVRGLKQSSAAGAHPGGIFGDLQAKDRARENPPTDDDGHQPGDTGKLRSVEDILFDVLCDSNQKVSINKFINSLQASGLRKTDPRLKESMRHFHDVQKQVAEFDNFDGVLIDRETFKECVQDNVVLIGRAFRNQFVVPEFSVFSQQIDNLYWKCRTNTRGKIADYIPQLARTSPDFWGVSVCTVDGQRHSMGDTENPFCLQSVSKPLNYAIGLHELGPEIMHQYVGVEPSGRSFNELHLNPQRKIGQYSFWRKPMDVSEERQKYRPHNPMINAGAIVLCSLLKNEMKLADRFDYIFNHYKRINGGEYLGFSNPTFLSEKETADRNFALGYYMRENKCFPEGSNLMETMDFYFHLCSIEMNCESASVVAATLANGGICPTTGERVLESTAVRNTLSLMYSCGMYDYSGQFAFKVGLPAKSGVSGAIIVVIPNVMGLCLWSPPLDDMGNSCRGIQFSEELVQLYNFHNYDNLKHTSKKLDPRRRPGDAKAQQIVSLLFGAFNGDVTAMKRYALWGIDMGQADYDGRTALHLASAEGHLETVIFLVEKCGVSVSPKDRWGFVPLDDAKRFGHVEVEAYLQTHMDQLKDHSESE